MSAPADDDVVVHGAAERGGDVDDRTQFQLMALIQVEKASMTGARGLWGIDTR